MSRNSKFIVGTSALLAVALLIWFYTVRSLRRTDASLAALTGKNQNLAAKLRRTESRLAAADRTHAELTQALASLGPVKPSAPAPAKSSDTGPRTQSELIANHPDLEVLELKRLRAVVIVEYGDFFRQRGVSPAQIEKFTENYVKNSERYMDLKAAARAQDDAGKQTVAKLQQQAQADYEAAQAEVLGAETHRQLDAYIRTVPVDNYVVRGLAGAAALEGIPLTAEQGEQLFQAAIRAGKNDPKDSGEQVATKIDWDALDAQARQILSPEQFALFTKVAPPSGFRSRWGFQLDAAIKRAQQADAADATKP